MFRGAGLAMDLLAFGAAERGCVPGKVWGPLLLIGVDG